MRQKLTPDDQNHLSVRSLSVDYAAGSVLPAHTHAWPQFLYARTGAIRAHIENTLWLIPPRNGLWIPGGWAHELQMLGAVKLRTLYFSPSLMRDDLALLSAPGALKVCGLLHEAVLRTCVLHALDRRKAQHVILASLLAAEIHSACHSTDRSALTLQMPKDARAKKLADKFIDPVFAHTNLAALCVDAGLSKRTAERVFHKETGLSPARWRRLVLLSCGLGACAAGASAEDAADLAGYQSRAAFCDAFSKTFGFPPGSLGKNDNLRNP